MATSIDPNKVASFIKMTGNRVAMGVFLFTKLPSAYFSGVRITDMDTTKCTAKVPYRWFSQNPFKSTYFACLAMAAELSTGALAMMYTRAASRRVSMLVTKMESAFTKKAKGVTWFTCEAGVEMQAAIERALALGEPQELQVVSTGIDKEGQVIATFRLTWSFKAN